MPGLYIHLQHTCKNIHSARLSRRIIIFDHKFLHVKCEVENFLSLISQELLVGTKISWYEQ